MEEAKALYDKMMSPRGPKGAAQGKGKKGTPKGGKAAKRPADEAAAGSYWVFWVPGLIRVPFLFLGETPEKFQKSDGKGYGKSKKPYEFQGKCAKCGRWGHKAVNCPETA